MDEEIASDGPGGAQLLAGGRQGFRYSDLEMALATLTRMLSEGARQGDVLQELCRQAMRALRISDVGISLASPDGVLHVEETATDLAHRVDSHQSRLQEGPCRKAFDETHWVTANGEDLVRSYPRFGPFALAQGVQGVAAFPLHCNGERIGVLDCYWTDPAQHLEGPALLVAQAIADAATVFVLHARSDADKEAGYVASLEAVNADLHDSREEALRASAAKTDLLSRTSHELRTPLNAILGFAQILEMTHGQDAEVVEPVSHILRAGRHLVNLVDDMLDVAQIESGHLDVLDERAGGRAGR
jgi:urease gamma subunit